MPAFSSTVSHQRRCSGIGRPKVSPKYGPDRTSRAVLAIIHGGRLCQRRAIATRQRKEIECLLVVASASVSVPRRVRPNPWRCRMAELPLPPDGIVLTHFIVSDDVERSRRFYTEVLGGRVDFPGDPVNVALANSWIVINSGGGPTDDKPTVTL